MRWNANMEIGRWAAQLRNTPQALQEAALKANTDSQKEHVKRLRRAAPLGDGPKHIRDTIDATDGDASKMEKVVSIGSADLDYILALEFGHKNGSEFVAPTRFFRAVRTIMRKKHARRTRTALRKAIKKVFPV